MCSATITRARRCPTTPLSVIKCEETFRIFYFDVEVNLAREHVWRFGCALISDGEIADISNSGLQ